MTNSTQIDISSALSPRVSRETMKLWKRMESAYTGGESFRRQFLWQHEREDDEDWLQRLHRSVYENHLRDLISRRESILFSRRIGRSIRSATLPWELVKNNMDGAGNDWSTFIRQAFTYSQLFGFAAVLIDQPTIESRTALEDSQLGKRPYLRLLHPLRILNWKKDFAGNLEWISVQTSDSPCVRLVITRDRVYTFEEESEAAFTQRSRELAPVSVVHHTAGSIPLIILQDIPSENQGFGITSLQSACDLSILYFNQSNWYDQLLYKTNYSTLAATPFGGANEESEMIVGSGDVFWVPDGGMMPSWISPDTAPADVFERRLAYMRRRIYELAALDVGHVEDKTRDLSGIAYAVRRLPTEEMALRLSRNLAQFEEQLISTFYQLAGHRVDVTISYPKRYGVRPLRDAMRDIETIEHSSLLPDKVKSYIASQIVFTEGFADLSDELQTAFEDAIRNHSASNSEKSHD